MSPETFIDNDGYETAILIRPDGTTEFRHVHEMVLAAFKGPCPDGHTIEHIDGNRRNNMLANLRYIEDDE